jgi:hypothetical protein
MPLIPHIICHLLVSPTHSYIDDILQAPYTADSVVMAAACSGALEIVMQVQLGLRWRSKHVCVCVRWWVYMGVWVVRRLVEDGFV